ncbi:MAG TPA: RsmE family RNA methyltransferase [Salinivirga sp.]|uniref:RsmE family RNA methyltransferase n=1 Tax=Salinivirga sp. TaxID=1970192 RepID=UPI002B497E00|nr:RsmE family RNA methyltransferase [Salinivirga sp.]HKK59403.1 RsmE family RNA methyltransferase [Salinivirga sp.]
MQKRATQEYYFYADKISPNKIILGKDEFHHISKVLKISINTNITLTDGRGNVATATVQSFQKRHIEFSNINIENFPKSLNKLHIAIAPTKNISRFEWFLEKATEIGISEITPIICSHSERKQLRADRLEKIVIAATKQSKKAWKPLLNPPISFNEFITGQNISGKYIAYLGTKSAHLKNLIHAKENLILVGPEGGFTESEHQDALQQGYKTVSLGSNRLRTETAGVVSATIVAMHHE